MKKIIFSMLLLTLGFTSYGQAPEGFKYQAVVRNASNIILANQAVGMQMTIKQGSATGTTVYAETFAVTTNAYGLVDLSIGSGTVVSGDFTTIDWSAGPYYMETASDLTGGTTYNVMGTSQLMSVPYALYAKTSGNGAGPVGPAGPAGTNGTDGVDGVDGLDGATGPMGPQGPAGTNGLDGATGPMGPQGPAGTNGVDGAVGATGPAGPQGPAGTNGVDGAVGATGPAGPQGPAGTNGLDGATGPMGPQGPAGTNGVDGAVGATGPAGPAGANGLDGATGPAGPAGATGPAGAANMTGTTNYVVKFTGATTGGNSSIQDNGTSVSINAFPSNTYRLYVSQTQLTATGDGQATIYGYRTRDSQNDGTGYSTFAANSGILGYNFWGDLYTFGVTGTSYNDYTRTGGVMGAQTSGTYWGSLGYKNSASATFGVYGSNAYGTGAGLLPTADVTGFGGGFFGMIGSASKGSVIGQLNSGELFASYNSGNTYTLGKNIELVGNEGSEKTAVYAVSSTKSTIYTQGTAQLVNGSAVIPFDSEYKALLGENPVVTVTPNGNCNGVYIASVDKNGFTVKEMNGGTSTVAISWISVGTRIDNRMEEATAMVSAPDFDRNIQQVLFNDGNKDRSGMGIWWDGTAIQFGTIPAHLTKVDRSAEEGK